MGMPNAPLLAGFGRIEQSDQMEKQISSPASCLTTHARRDRK